MCQFTTSGYLRARQLPMTPVRATRCWPWKVWCSVLQFCGLASHSMTGFLFNSTHYDLLWSSFFPFPARGISDGTGFQCEWEGFSLSKYRPERQLSGKCCVWEHNSSHPQGYSELSKSMLSLLRSRKKVCTGRGGVKHSLTCQITSSHECIMQGSASEKAVWLSLLHHHADDELVILHITICIFPYASCGSFRPHVPDCWLVSLHGLPRTWQPFNSFALCCVFSLGTICSVTAALLVFPLAGRHNNPGHRLL